MAAAAGARLAGSTGCAASCPGRGSGRTRSDEHRGTDPQRGWVLEKRGIAAPGATSGQMARRKRNRADRPRVQLQLSAPAALRAHRTGNCGKLEGPKSQLVRGSLASRASRPEAAHVMLLRPVFRLHQTTDPGGKLPNDADEGHLGYSGSSLSRQPIRWLPGRAFSESLLLISYVRYPERFPNNRSADYGSCQETETCAW